MMPPTGIALIRHYFPELSDQKLLQFEKLGPLYEEWNAKINVVSRKDLAELYLRHVLHSLAIARFIHFDRQAKIFDLGCGGGFPGIPLAIMFPETHFLLCDSIAKKIRVVQAVADALHLTNVQTFAGRAETVKGNFNFVVSRAVAEFPLIRSLTKHLISRKDAGPVPNGWICLKGGDISNEIAGLKRIQQINIADWFSEPFFETKKLIYIPKQ